jgi:predicted NAD-dependent protein-ADP-ribosyltransferase YbiA (DUF1768 family)
MESREISRSKDVNANSIEKAKKAGPPPWELDRYNFQDSSKDDGGSSHCDPRGVQKSKTYVSSQKFGVGKTDHPDESRPEAPSLLDNQDSQAMLPLDINKIQTYHRAECIVFLKTKERFGGLSNMAAGYPLLVNGIRILTSEALYQACRFPHKPDIQKLIIEQASPMAAKMKSKNKSHHKYSREDWYAVSIQIMRWCLRVKLAQNPHSAV